MLDQSSKFEVCLTRFCIMGLLIQTIGDNDELITSNGKKSY